MTDLYEDTDPMIGPDNKPKDIVIKLSNIDNDDVSDIHLWGSKPFKNYPLLLEQRTFQRIIL